MIYAYAPAYFIGANVYDFFTYQYFKTLDDEAVINVMAQIKTDNILNSVIYKFGMSFLVSAITWLVNERELIMFFRQQDQKEMKE